MRDFSSSDFGLDRADQKFRDDLFTVPRSSADDNCEHITLNASLNDDGSIEGTQTHKYAGDRAAGLRENILEAEAYQIREFIERMANISFRAATVIQHKVDDLSDPDKPLVIEYRFKAPGFGKVVGKEIVIDQALPLLRLGSSFATLETRRTPLQISSDFNSRFHGTLRIPPGAKPVTIPSSFSIETDFGSYHLSFAELDN